MEIKAKPWSELTNFHTPLWLKEKKFGIYTHWGVYSVAAHGYNVSWYPYRMYQEGHDEFEYHCKRFGHPSQFGYKDLIPLFDGSKFDADEWAELFSDAGAQFAGPVAEHHDGFSMWDSKINRWNAKAMGPKRDVVGELERAYRKRGMNFLTAFHHAENWKFYRHWIKEYDTADPQYADLYGEAHNLDAPRDLDDWNKQDQPSKNFLDRWLGKLREAIDAYNPDMIWFDFGLEFIADYYKRAFLSYYYDSAARRNQDVIVTYKYHNLPVGSGLIDLEQGRFDKLTYNDWITDTTVDNYQAWAYLEGGGYKSSKALIHYLIDNVSKNGYMLLNVGPKPDGTIPEQAKQILKDMGGWLKVNGEAIYGTTPWVVAEEGPTKMQKSGAFSEWSESEYTPNDIRFTMKDDVVYAICLGEIGNEVEINSLVRNYYPGEIASINLLEDGRDLKWKQEGDKIIIYTDGVKRRPDANVFKIRRNQIHQND